MDDWTSCPPSRRGGVRAIGPRVQGQPAVTLHLGLPPDGVENVTTADMTGFDHLVTAMSSLDAIGGVVAEPPGFPTHGEVSAMAAPIRQVSG